MLQIFVWWPCLKQPKHNLSAWMNLILSASAFSINFLHLEKVCSVILQKIHTIGAVFFSLKLPEYLCWKAQMSWRFLSLSLTLFQWLQQYKRVASNFHLSQQKHHRLAVRGKLVSQFQQFVCSTLRLANQGTLTECFYSFTVIQDFQYLMDQTPEVQSWSWSLSWAMLGVGLYLPCCKSVVIWTPI